MGGCSTCTKTACQKDLLEPKSNNALIVFEQKLRLYAAITWFIIHFLLNAEWN